MPYQSDQINELASALAKAQGEMQHATKSASNPFFKSNYADLPAVIDAARNSLAKHGLSVAQPIVTDEQGNMSVSTMLMHSSGQWLMSSYPLRPVKSDPQSVGSAIAYARRYSYAAIVGVAAVGEDDDGNAASQNGTSKSSQTISTDQAVEIDLLINEVRADKGNFLKYLGVDDVRKIPADKFATAIAALNKKRSVA